MFQNPSSPDRIPADPAKYEFETPDVFQILYHISDKWLMYTQVLYLIVQFALNFAVVLNFFMHFNQMLILSSLFVHI